MSRRARTGSLGELLPIAAVEPDGLMVTTDGRYVRLIECQRVPNAITADAEPPAGSRAGVPGAVPRDPRPPVAGGLRADRSDPDRRGARRGPRPRRGRLRAGHRRGNGELAATRRRFLAGLTQTVFGAAGAEQPAVAARWWVAVPYQPAAAETPREQLRHAAMRARGKTSWAAHHARRGREPAADRADPGRARRRRDRDLSARRRARRSRCCGSAFTPPPSSPTSTSSPTRSASLSDQPATRPRSSATACSARCATARRRGSTPARTPGTCATPTGRSRRSCTSAPRRCRPARGGCRTCSPARCRRRSRCTSPSGTAAASRAASAGGGSGCAPPCSTRSAAVSSSAQTSTKRSTRPQAVDAELASEIGATVYKVGIYCAIRDPRGDPREFERDRRRHRPRVSRAHQRAGDPRPAAVPARVDRDAAARRRHARARRAATRSATSRTACRLTSTSCGSPSGLILGTADPGGTLERIDPFDPLLPPPGDAGARPVGRRQDGADERAADARDLAGDARLDHRPLLHPGPRRPDRRHAATTTRCCRWSPARGACRSARPPAT